MTFGLDNFFWARPLSTPLMIAVFAAVVLLSIYLYRRAWGLPLWLRISLGAARLVALALVVASLFEPTAVVSETHTQARTLPVLIDVSESMSMKDERKNTEDIAAAAAALGYLGQENLAPDELVMRLDAEQRQTIQTASRLDLARGILRHPAAPVLEELGESFDISFHSFGKSTRILSDNNTITAAQLDALTATDPATSIAASLEAVAKSGVTTPAGIILLTDGIENTSSQRIESVLQDLGARGIPVFPVAIGLEQPDDVSIRNIVMQEVAFSGDSVPVQVQILSKGYEKRTARLTIQLNDRQVFQRVVRLEGGLQFEDVEFNMDLYEKGAARVAVAIEPFEDEISTANNRVERSTRVVNEKVNVLYIEGNNRWEFRYLSAILKRDPRLNTTFISSSAGPEFARNSPEHIERFPSKREEAFKYDLIILGDVDSAFFSPEELALLEELIRDRGASLLVLCGPMHTPSSYSGTPVETLLPIRFDADAEWEMTAESVYPVLTPEGRSSMVMVLENDPEENDRVWSRAAPLDHLPPLTGVKPGATILATLSDSTAGSQTYPLVAWHRYGTGKCMTFATDRLWRLRFKTGDKYHWRVWSQSIQFLTLSRLMGEHKRIRIETDRTLYQDGEQARLYAHVLDEDYEPVVQPSFTITVNGTDGNALRETLSLQADRTSPGLYEGYFTAPAAGRYRLEANEDDAEISNTTEFQVATVNRELSDTNMRRDGLQRIAQLTGGTLLAPADLTKLGDLLDSTPVTTTVRSERPLWDNWLIAILLVALLGMEWILRRRNDLT
ncbi:MAG: MG2 domain-containing protein [Luteolibacter sp.]